MQTALTEFLRDVDEVKVYLDLLQGVMDFAVATTPAVEDAHAGGLAQRARDAGTPAIQIGHDGALLTLSASFEEFVANLVSRYAEGLPTVIKNYSSLPEKFRRAHERFTGEVLSRFPNDRVRAFVPEVLVRNLYNCYQDAVPYKLNGQAVALTDNNISGSELATVFTRVGISKVWEKVGKKTQVRDWFGATSAEDVGAGAKNKLDQFVIDRNHTIHRGAEYRPIGPDSLKSYLGYFSVLAPVLVTVCEDQLRTLERR
ncbi:MAG: HEPN domain-containing protein [Dehalococcoidia bacterium]|nr:HEPN domain-containing protein [Dehalococcoidia bacterium]